MNSKNWCGSLLALAFAFLLPRTALANDGEIRIEMDPHLCGGFIACGETRQLKIYVSLHGATRPGITGLEMGMQIGADGAADPGWEFMETFAPDATIAIGQGLFGPPDERAIAPRRNRHRGINMAWSSCQNGDDHEILIETVHVANTGCVAGVLQLLGTDHDTPGNSFFRCPLATLCDAPVYTKVCLGDNVTVCTNLEGPNGDPAHCSTSGFFILNPPSGVNLQAPCGATAVQPSSWSAVKGMYR